MGRAVVAVDGTVGLLTGAPPATALAFMAATAASTAGAAALSWTRAWIIGRHEAPGPGQPRRTMPVPGQPGRS